MRKITHTLLVATLSAVFLVPPAESANRGHAAQAVSRAKTDAAKRGRAVFDQWCSGCHAPLNAMPGFPPAGTYLLQQRYNGATPAALEDRVDLEPDLIKAVVRTGLPIMPPFRKTEVTDADLDAVVAYLIQKKPRPQASAAANPPPFPGPPGAPPVPGAPGAGIPSRP